MIKGAILAVGMFAFGTSTALAEVLFQGAFTVTAVTPACQETDVGFNGTSIFHPNTAGNANFSGISFVQQFFAIGHLLNGAPFDGTFRNVQTGGVGWGDAWTWTGSQLRLLAPIPPPITVQTRFVSLRGQIKKFYNDPGGAACVITFEASYSRR